MLELPALAGDGPDVTDALAALDPNPDPLPEGDAATPASVPEGGPPAPPGDAPKRGRGRPPAELWSERKISRASRAELKARVKALQERAPSAPAIEGPAAPDPADAPPPPPLDPAELAAPLALTFRTLGGLLALAYGDAVRLTEDEATTLGAAWAPLAAKYAGQGGAWMEWAVPILTTAGVALPKVHAYRDAQRLAEAAPATAAELPPPLRGPDA